MKFTGDNSNVVVLHSIDQPVFVIYAPAPIAFKVVFKGFGFASTFKRCTGSFQDKFIEPGIYTFIGGKPLVVLFKSGRRKSYISHALGMLTLIDSPFLSWAMDFSRIALLTGEDIR